MLLILIEHCLIIFKIFLQGVIPDVPKKVLDSEFERGIQTAQAEKALMKAKSEN